MALPPLPVPSLPQLPVVTKPEPVSVVLDGQERTLQTFSRISGLSFQHPDDGNASNALQGIPIFPQLFSMLNTNYLDQRNRMSHLMNNLRLGPTQGAALYAKCVLACRILDVPVMPEFYLNTYPLINAYACGVSQPIICLSHGCLTSLSETELLAVVGHELGHIKCQHMFNQSLAELFGAAGVSGMASLFPVVGVAAVYGVRAALGHWSRMAEFSCDRAALLVSQDAAAVASVIAKIAGFSSTAVPDFNFEALYAQLDEYNRYDDDAYQSLVKLQKVVIDSIDSNNTHPAPILRIKRIIDWSRSDQYEDLIAGKYAVDTSITMPRLAGDSPKCPTCGQLSPVGSKFCSHCGHSL